MNSGSYALEPITQDGALVTISLTLIAIFAVLTVIAMLWGARLKRQRRAAEQEEATRIDALRAEGVETSTTPAALPDQPPVAPSPPPAPSTPVVEPAPPPPPPPVATPPAAPTPPTADAMPVMPDAAVIAAPVPATPPVPPAAPSSADVAVHAEPGAQSITILKGLGPKIEARLAELGITRVDQLAWLDDAEAAALDSRLGVFQGRMERDRWREQARLLAQGDRAGYEAQFGRLG